MEEGIVYVDAGGRFTFASQTARDLLQWVDGELALGDVLPGGAAQAATLLQSVARQEVIEHMVTFVCGAAQVQLATSALALRDRDGNLWGAALFLHRPHVGG